MAIPHREKIKEELASYILREENKGIAVTPEMAYEALAEIFKLTEADLLERRPTGEEAWPNEVRFARWELVTEGIILSPKEGKYGVWKLADEIRHDLPNSEIELSPIYADLHDEGVFNPANISDARDIILRAIVQRRGQYEFRRSLLTAYNSSCAISSENFTEVLEAAHIIPYKGSQTNVVQNGLLLRADIHTLFDLHLITINPTSHRVEVAPKLYSSGYGAYQDKPIFLPKDSSHHPSTEALKSHRDQCVF